MAKKMFASEVLLQQAVAELLRKMPGTEDVKILQGTRELGKDIVFTVSGALGERLNCACVIKNTKISGAVGKSTGARTVYQQAQQALDSPHLDDSGREVRSERVYVISPHPLSQSSIVSIQGHLKEKSGQVVFVCGAALFKLFRDYWPDFLADESNALERYLGGLNVDLDDNKAISALSSLYSLGMVDSGLRKVYVMQGFQRQVYAYVPGYILESSIPRVSELGREWGQADLRRAAFNVSQCIYSLELLDEWGFLSAAGGRSRVVEIATACKKILTGLEVAWTKGMKAKFNVRSSRLPRSVADAKCRIVPAEETRQSMLQTKRTMDDTLSHIKRIASRVMTVAARLKSIGTKALADGDFHEICAIDDLAHFAPEGVFLRRLTEPEPVLSINFSANLLDEWKSHLMIVGAPGLGKTSFCRWNALWDAERLSCGKSHILPVYIPLHRLANQNIDTIEQVFEMGAGSSGLTGLRTLKAIKSFEGNIRLYLDGLDEISSLSKQKQIVELAKVAAQSNPNFQIIITSRDYVHGNWLKWLPRIGLKGLDDIHIQELVNKWLCDEPKTVKTFWSQMDDAPTLVGMMRTPLLATLILLVFKRTGKLPENRTKLYELFVILLSGEWDLAKGIPRKTMYGERIKLMVLSSLARMLHESRTRGFGNKELQGIVRAQSKKLGKEWESVKNELLQDGLISIGGGVMYFSHLSFQEFLTARDFIEGARPRRAVSEYLHGDDWWREVLHFYVGLCSRPEETTKWLLAEIDRAAGDDTEYVCDRNRANDLLSSVTESFPEYTLEELIGYDPVEEARAYLSAGR